MKQEEESISEIQNYLDTFNKEIEDPNQHHHHHAVVAGAGKEVAVVEDAGGEVGEQAEDGGTYFVDQSGQYYYQSNDVDGGDGTATLVAQEGGTMVSIPTTAVSKSLSVSAVRCDYSGLSPFSGSFGRGCCATG